MGRQQQQGLPLCMLLLMAVLVLSAMHAVPAEAGRALANSPSKGAVRYGPLIPGYTPSVPRGQPYTGGGCPIYKCNPPPAGGAP